MKLRNAKCTVPIGVLTCEIRALSLRLRLPEVSPPRAGTPVPHVVLLLRRAGRGRRVARGPVRRRAGRLGPRLRRRLVVMMMMFAVLAAVAGDGLRRGAALDHRAPVADLDPHLALDGRHAAAARGVVVVV